MKNLLILFGLIILFSACEEQMVMIPFDPPTVSGKVVLVEELTGVKCPNCPAGSARLESILTKYPKNVVVVGIHGRLLTEPLKESAYDFRNPDSEALDEYLKPYLGKPSAYINRTVFSDEYWGNPVIGQWESIVEDELEKPQITELSIVKNYDPTTRVLEVDVTAFPLETVSGEYKLTIMLTESEIVDAQEDPMTIIEDYVHHHVLRDVITKFDGDAFANTLEESVLITKRYTYTIPEDDTGWWNDDHIEVVAFLTNTEGESEEVLQAAKTYLKD